jgi:hypothetical protein
MMPRRKWLPCGGFSKLSVRAWERQNAPRGRLTQSAREGRVFLEEAKRNFLEMMEAVALHGSKRVLPSSKNLGCPASG